jgi:hypothetical protein
VANKYQATHVDATRVRDQEVQKLSRLLDEGWRVHEVHMVSTRAVLILALENAEERAASMPISSRG